MKFLYSFILFASSVVAFQTEGQCALCAECKHLYKECVDLSCPHLLGSRKKKCIKNSGCDFSQAYTECKKVFCADENMEENDDEDDDEDDDNKTESASSLPQ
jgi:hypothetical protein